MGLTEFHARRFGWNLAEKGMSMKTQLLALVILTAGSAVAADISIGINIGAPPPPRVVVVQPPVPGPDFVWVQGYWYPVEGRYHWHEGYWTRPPYEGAIWVAPRHDGARYFAGYWEGGRGRFEHDHRWDKDHDRDRRGWREHERDEDHDRGRGRGHDHDRE
jgi:hypothetical protein